MCHGVRNGGEGGLGGGAVFLILFCCLLHWSTQVSDKCARTTVFCTSLSLERIDFRTSDLLLLQTTLVFVDVHG